MIPESADKAVDILGASFRDPSGFIFTFNGNLYRQINQSYQENYERLIESGLYDELLKNEYLLPHQEVSVPPPKDEIAYKIIQPERLSYISYPYEFSFSQLKDAALATLNIEKIALKYGMSLKDSSAYNIQFHAGRPTLIDTLSFEIYNPGKPWIAYRQFCQHFLAPLSLMAYRDVRMANLLKSYIDGLPLDLTSSLLPMKTRLVPSLLLHIHLHASSQKRYADVKPDMSRRFSQNALLGLIDNLEGGIRRLGWSKAQSSWAAYYQEEHSYSDAGLAHKQELVREYLNLVKPEIVWDLGANTGMFSRIAASLGAYTVAFDYDPLVVELNYREMKQKKESNLLPFVQDLTNPSPAVGWRNRERSSLIERANADLTMSLALVHHLLIANNVPLDQLADFFYQLSRWQIIEFIPKSDHQVQRLLTSREDIFLDYSSEAFEAEFSKRFLIHRKEAIQDSARCLYLMERH